VYIDLSQKENDLKDLKSNVETMQKVAQERENHTKEEKMMSEQIFLNDQGAALDHLRRQFFSHFIWNMLSSQHFEREKVKYKVYEEAYAKIKIATGISDVPHFVDKFLTQEQRYNDFLLAVKTKEEKVLQIKENIQNMQNLINNVTSSNQLSETSDRRGTNTFRLTQKQLVESLFKQKRLKMTIKKISDWIRRLIFKIEGFSQGDSENLLLLMTSLKNQVLSKLKSSKPTLQSTILKLKHQKNSEIIENLMKP
jgi:dephospho-CoA kinase